ncbi:hypothetical protein C1645_804816 [Glomus cerebriforme]|uniref:Protein kinase domain-containing protein n=1 Tax=Glomus cerebriforme TaxID=658196 RepID=A0A397T4C4_9GLOM|nr:hypothetical protein C1645_804816 [Glomus cerebriforme]
MEPTNANNRNSFDPIPRLKSSPIPILFVPFKQDDENCIYCENKYSETLLVKQKYCENCLLKYIKDINDNDTYLDVHISTKDIHCKEHETIRDKNFCTLNIQEWCKNCSIITWFKQLVQNPLHLPYFYAIDIEKQIKIIEIEEECKLCGRLIQRFFEFYKFRICSKCYLISSGWTESIYKRSILIVYLPWWDATNECRVCGNLDLIFSYCQKWCSTCYVLYIGCRYCLTTNIIFGLTDKSQCKKCKRTICISSNILKRSSGHNNIDDFLHNIRFNTESHHKIANYTNNNINKDSNLSVYDIIKANSGFVWPESNVNWIPYSQITILNEIAKGGYSIIYKAIWSPFKSHYYNRKSFHVAIKKFLNTQDFKKYFLTELKSYYKHNYYGNVIMCHGVTMNPETNDCINLSEYNIIFDKAESKRLELIQLKKLGPEFTEKPHSKAIYTSRSLRSLFPNSSNYSYTSINPFNIKQEYVSKELDFDID